MENNKNTNTPGRRNVTVKTLSSQKVRNVSTPRAQKKVGENEIVTSGKPSKKESQMCSLSCLPSTSKTTHKTLTRKNVIKKKQEPKVREVKGKSILKTKVEKSPRSGSSSLMTKTQANRPKADTPKGVRFREISDPGKVEHHIYEEIGMKLLPTTADNYTDNKEIDTELPSTSAASDIKQKIIFVSPEVSHQLEVERDQNNYKEIYNDSNPRKNTIVGESSENSSDKQNLRNTEEEEISLQSSESSSHNQEDENLQIAPLSIIQSEGNLEKVELDVLQIHEDVCTEEDTGSSHDKGSDMSDKGSQDRLDKDSTSKRQSANKINKNLLSSQLHHPKTPEENSKSNLKNCHYHSPPVVLKTLSSGSSGNKISEVLIYQLGSYSTPRKTRKNILMNGETKSDWGTPKTNHYPTYNWLSRNTIVKRGINKLNINKRKISEIPSALVKPVNIKSAKQIKDNNNKTMQLGNSIQKETSRKLTSEIYSVTPVSSLVKRFENFISGKPTSIVGNDKTVNIKIRTGFCGNKETNSSESTSNPESSKVLIDSEKSNSFKRKFSFSDDEEEVQRLDNALQHQNVDSDNCSSQVKLNANKKLKISVYAGLSEKVNPTEKEPHDAKDKEIKNSSKESDVFKSTDELSDLSAIHPLEGAVGITVNHNDSSHHTESDKSEKVSPSFYLPDSSTSDNILTVDSGFSESNLSDNFHQNSTQFKDGEENGDILNNIKEDEENYFRNIENCKKLFGNTPGLVNTERDIDVLRTYDEDNFDLLDNNDKGNFITDGQGDDTPTASVSMLFKIAEDLLDSPMSYTEYRREFYKRLSIENSPLG